MLDDPEVQKGLVGALLSLLAATWGVIWWTFRRAVGRTDEIRRDVDTLKQTTVSRKTMDKQMGDLQHRYDEILGRIESRVDDIYREMPKRSTNHR